jgi:hypothetical protein
VLESRPRAQILQKNYLQNVNPYCHKCNNNNIQTNIKLIPFPMDMNMDMDMVILVQILIRLPAHLLVLHLQPVKCLLTPETQVNQATLPKKGTLQFFFIQSNFTQISI